MITMDAHNERQDPGIMKGPSTALEMQKLSEDKDGNELVRLGKKPVLKVRRFSRSHVPESFYWNCQTTKF